MTPNASCCGQPRVTPRVDRCYDCAKVCTWCRIEPSEDGVCPRCRALHELPPAGTQRDVLTTLARVAPDYLDLRALRSQRPHGDPKSDSALKHALRTLSRKGLVVQAAPAWRSDLPNGRDW